MAQKAAKTLAARNTSLLRRTHLTTLTLHLLYLLLHFLFNRPRSLTPYLLLTTPTLAIEFYLEKLGRPRYNSGADGGSLRSAGEDLDAKGLTEYLWDVLYWTWGCMGAVCLFGDRAWWLWAVVPAYSAWLGYSTVMGVRKGGLAGLGGMGGMGGEAGATGEGAESKRQKKMEKRGGQRVRYR
ncbi:hypothetical protein AJ79_03671 [Helicocarpus griseus UAMH5409]|uniref:DUF788 domain-containing protein n=1 Tax=Helicocarpus griseus UAMH5409 TaxID=1447875 RepID=A0A2B7XXP7_9EURO|nr:hypothetical protein AJ79_03671 [Helicocarpus griseus UAMH5409]